MLKWRKNGLQLEPVVMGSLDKDYYAGNGQFVSLPTMLTTAGRAIGGDQINILSSGFAKFNLGLGTLEVTPPAYEVPQASLWWQEYAFSEANIKEIARELNFPADLLMAQVAGSLSVNYTHVAEKYRNDIATNDTVASKMIVAYRMADDAYKEYQRYMGKHEASRQARAPIIGRRSIS